MDGLYNGQASVNICARSNVTFVIGLHVVEVQRVFWAKVDIISMTKFSRIHGFPYFFSYGAPFTNKQIHYIPTTITLTTSSVLPKSRAVRTHLYLLESSKVIFFITRVAWPLFSTLPDNSGGCSL